MRRRLFPIFLLMALAIAPPVAAFEATTVAAPGAGPADVLRSAGFGNVFAAFGESIVFSPRQQGVTDERFLRAWENDVAVAFGSGALNDELVDRLGALDPADLAGVAGFLGSSFGLRVAALEHAVQSVPAGQQLAVLAKGQTLYWRISDTRRAQFDELMHLSGMEVSFAILSETLRAAAVSLHMSQDTGDLEVPWAEIDAGVTEQLSGMHDRLLEATRATFAYTYESLTDEELETYLAFLRAPAAQNFYGAATVAVGDIIRRTMLDLGQRVAARLNAVQI
jgi:hypothetical protein